MSLPPLYARWMDELLAAPIASETRATCDDCAMAPKPEDTSGERRFDPKLKCCTYYPELPNYTVGAIIQDPTASGRLELKRRFDRATGITPLGLSRPAVYQVLLAKSTGGDAFGRAQSLRCAFLDDDGRCGMWAYREPTCFSYHCKFDRGAKGAALWKSLNELFTAIEKQLALWCVVELDPGDAALALLVKPQGTQPIGHTALDGAPDKREMQALWGTWQGREVEFFTESWRRVSALRWSDVLAICGPDVRTRARTLVATFARHQDTTLPDPLRVAAFQSSTVDRRTRLRTFSPTDSIDLAPPVVAALVEFDGRPTAQVVHELAARGVELDDAELRRLVDHEVLVPAKR